MSSKPTVKDVIDRAGVSFEDLKHEYTDDDILNGLADLCDPWKLVGTHLRLTQEQLNAIDKNNGSVEGTKIAVLRKVKENRLDVTYLNLIKALLACNKAQQALKVCQWVKRSHPETADGKDGGLSSYMHDVIH